MRSDFNEIWQAAGQINAQEKGSWSHWPL